MSSDFTPSTVEEIASVLRAHHERSSGIAIRGAGTHSFHAERPVLSLSAYTGIITHAADDLTITVRAGTPIRDVQTRLRAQGQWLPLEPPYTPESTVGGVVATALTGYSRARYGEVRDWVIAMRYVCADGSIARSGSNVVKSVAGYDLHRLLTGSRGTLCVIADVTFKVAPLPESHAFAITAVEGGALPDRSSMLQSLPALAIVASPALSQRLSLGAGMQFVRRFDGYAEDVESALARVAGSSRIVRHTDPEFDVVNDGVRDWNLLHPETVSLFSADVLQNRNLGALNAEWAHDVASGVVDIESPDALSGASIGSIDAAYRFQNAPVSGGISTSESERMLAARLKATFDPHDIFERWALYSE